MERASHGGLVTNARCSERAGIRARLQTRQRARWRSDGMLDFIRREAGPNTSNASVLAFVQLSDACSGRDGERTTWNCIRRLSEDLALYDRRAGMASTRRCTCRRNRTDSRYFKRTIYG